MKNRNEKGFSLMEVVFSLGLLGIVTAGIAPSFIHHVKLITKNETRTRALSAAQTVLDEIRVSNPQDLPTSGSSTPQTVVVGKNNFSVVTNYCIASEYCTSINTRHLHLVVSHQGESIYELETVYTKLK